MTHSLMYLLRPLLRLSLRYCLRQQPTYPHCGSRTLPSSGVITSLSRTARLMAPLSLTAVVCIVRDVSASGLLDAILDFLHGDLAWLLTPRLYNLQRYSNS